MFSFDGEPDATTAGAFDAQDAVLRLVRPAQAGRFDELRVADASAETGGVEQLREPWRRFFDRLGSQGLADLDRRAALLARQIHEDGVTYNVYSDAGGTSRPWPLELLPALIEPEDWRQIEQGVAQRAALLNSVLADVYGEQRVLRDGLLPPALVLGHPGYLRGLQGQQPPGGLYLHIVAFDLARGPDGRFCVLAQRTQAPSGMGYVLENRLAVSRLFPQAFRELNVQHLASGFRRLVETLQTLAAPCAQGEPPRLALLTPGPYNETYFEHAYLARYLGLPLVEGGDLIVRDERVYLKTVHGLEPVHGLLRRLDDDYCDPLELKPDSTLGVPGLLQAVRAGNVVMANALGTGFLESPGVQGFLPAIARRWLGHDLLLPSLPTWWCGEEAAWQAVQPELAGKIMHPSYPAPFGLGASRSLRPGFKSQQVESAAVAEWIERVASDPAGHTVQGAFAFSQTPVWSGGAVQPRGMTLRVFAVADGHGGWQVMPGGMGRTAETHAAVSMQYGGSSFDTWVLTDGPVDTFSMLPKPLHVEDLVKQQRPVASRTAENLFWMGRYTERTENNVRLARTLFTVLGEEDEQASPDVLNALSGLAASSGLVLPGVPSLAQSARLFERALIEALPKPSAYSVGYNLQALARTAGALRDRLSPEHWRLIRDMSEDFSQRMQAAPELLSEAEAVPALEWLGVQLAAVTGSQADRMTRDVGWRLLTVGRYIERLIAYAGILRAFFERPAAAQPQGFDVLLALFDSTITFRARFQRRLELPALLDLVVMDESNPRALACVLRRLRTELGKLPRRDDAGADTVAGLLAILPEQGVGASLAELCEPLWQVDAAAHPIPRLADQLAQAAARLSNEIGRCYFSHATAPDRLLAS